MRTAGEQDLGIRLILLYKVAKAAVQMALAVALVALATSGDIATVREWAAQARAHVASRLSLLLGRAVGALVSERGLHVLEIGLVLDAIVSAVEGWSLWRGYRWAAWLVVLATASPLPFEVEEIVRTHRASRIVLVAVNTAVVVYLALRIARKRDATRTG